MLLSWGHGHFLLLAVWTGFPQLLLMLTFRIGKNSQQGLPSLGARSFCLRVSLQHRPELVSAITGSYRPGSPAPSSSARSWHSLILFYLFVLLEQWSYAETHQTVSQAHGGCVGQG